MPGCALRGFRPDGMEPTFMRTRQHKGTMFGNNFPCAKTIWPTGTCQCPGLTKPPALVKAHQAMDKAVDKCYRTLAFANDAKRVEYLFELYEEFVREGKP